MSSLATEDDGFQIVKKKGRPSVRAVSHSAGQDVSTGVYTSKGMSRDLRRAGPKDLSKYLTDDLINKIKRASFRRCIEDLDTDPGRRPLPPGKYSLTEASTSISCKEGYDSYKYIPIEETVKYLSEHCPVQNAFMTLYKDGALKDYVDMHGSQLIEDLDLPEIPKDLKNRDFRFFSGFGVERSEKDFVEESQIDYGFNWTKKPQDDRENTGQRSSQRDPDWSDTPSSQTACGADNRNKPQKKRGGFSHRATKDHTMAVHFYAGDFHYTEFKDFNTDSPESEYVYGWLDRRDKEIIRYTKDQALFFTRGTNWEQLMDLLSFPTEEAGSSI